MWSERSILDYQAGRHFRFYRIWGLRMRNNGKLMGMNFSKFKRLLLKIQWERWSQAKEMENIALKKTRALNKTCLICYKFFVTKASRDMHVKIDHEKTQAKEMENIALMKTRALNKTFLICYRFFVTKASRDVHVKIDHEKTPRRLIIHICMFSVWQEVFSWSVTEETFWNSQGCEGRYFLWFVWKNIHKEGQSVAT